jgi:hypothetical protein
MRSYYKEFYVKVWIQSFGTGAYILFMFINSCVFVHYLRKMEKNETENDLSGYWLITTEITTFNLLINCLAITIFVIFKLPVNFFQIFNRLPNMTFSLYQYQTKEEIY